jgi:hypothetical protein
MAVGLLVIGSLLRPAIPMWTRITLIGVFTVAVMLREYGVVRFKLPENRRLVPESVFRLGRFFGPFQFGIEMGTGARTYLPTSLPYAVALTVVLIASPAAALASGLGFGLGRVVTIVANLRYDGLNGWERVWRAEHRLVRAILGGGFTIALATAVTTAVGWRVLD